ncbi:DNA helicase II/ATP-dependent DNA helicase PcrA [Paraburkholderia ribeironis]|uniref:DNA 3'-5' helicase II n=1 Tax=Paraburkholderia ribeironis TaxID=1247936 RepID=A0A1N7SFN0_9BURK|nr:ATP-dependent helicase [Paraburkholderia ribeironis]SIT46205.1 DNA helicase II/ATP-dependent DNA helicase PcrA [Paraburkholderia ribeironis]
MELTKGQQEVLDADGHLLVVGGPGSGKTTVSILKAATIAGSELAAGQKILFVSFARATVSRVVEAIEHEQRIPSEQKRLIEVETYHSFFWRILKSHGYLVGLPRRIDILTPPGEAIALASIRAKFPVRKLTDVQKEAKLAAEEAERTRLAIDDGRICFDLFATYVGEILYGSDRVCRLISDMYPVIILDEFQDTNGAQWRVVQALGKYSRLIALADPEQRIYDWIGADPARLDQFRKTFKPVDVDLSTDNHRSAGTEIGMFGNDLLTGKFRQPAYEGVKFRLFEPFTDPAMTMLVTTTYAARQRLIKLGIKDWSLTILVPTKRMTRLVSDALRQPPAGMQAISHTAVVEMEAAILSAEVIALLMQLAGEPPHFAQLIDLLCHYYQGKGGDEPSQEALNEAVSLRKAYDELVAAHAKGKAVRKNSIIVNVLAVYEQVCALQLTGDPDADWRAVRNVLEVGACKRLREVAEAARSIRVLDRGTQLRQDLSQDWRNNGGYRNALEITRQAFVQQHFSTGTKPESGVVVMNMHKAKGKQFDEVITFEGWPVKRKGLPPFNGDRIVRFNLRENVDDQARQTFRVSVTRGKRRVTILTPRGDPCVLLVGEKLWT